jgi:hypothetical protein
MIGDGGSVILRLCRGDGGGVAAWLAARADDELELLPE